MSPMTTLPTMQLVLDYMPLPLEPQNTLYYFFHTVLLRKTCGHTLMCIICRSILKKFNFKLQLPFNIYDASK